MVAPHAQLDTPYTEGRNGFFTNSSLDISMEPSFHSPSKGANNLVSQPAKNKRERNVRTPRSRIPFAERRNAPAQAEFTPLMKSVTRTNHERKLGKENVVPATPAALRKGLESIAGSPSLPLPQGGDSVYGGDDISSFAHNDSVATPVANLPSSSAASTPHPTLGKRDHGGAVIDSGQVLSLREQELAVSTLEKSNFDLKLKVHFLEEILQKNNPAYNATALKENAELKALQIGMGKELKRCKRNLIQTERDLESYRQQLAQMQENMKRRHADESHLEEVERLNQLLRERDQEIETLRMESQTSEGKDDDLQKFRDDISDLEAELREKERIIDGKEDEIEKLEDDARNHEDAVSDLEEQLALLRSREDQLPEKDDEIKEHAENIRDLEDELESFKGQIEDLKSRLDHEKSHSKTAEAELADLLQAKEGAEEELASLREEIADKSFTAKGSSRQLEDKASRLQNEVHVLQEERQSLFLQCEDKSRESEQNQQRISELKQEHELEIQTLIGKLELANHEKDIATREQRVLNSRLESFETDLGRKTEEKDLLRSRHDALTTESESLQKDLTRYQDRIRELEDEIDVLKERDAGFKRKLSDNAQEEVQKFKDDYEDLRMAYDENERQHDHDLESWETERDGLVRSRDSAEDQIAVLEKTVEKLQKLDGAISTDEEKMQQALQSEKVRNATQEASLIKEINQLNDDMELRRRQLEQNREEANKLREELRAAKREQNILQEKVQGLEDEVELLHNSLEEGQGIDARLGSAEAQLSATRREKQALHDKVANLAVEVSSLQVSLADVEAQRDRLDIELKSARGRSSEVSQRDQLDLRTAKARLEATVTRLKEEKVAFVEKVQVVERELEEEREKAGAEETRMEVEIEDLKRKLLVASGSNNRELTVAKRTILHLEQRVAELDDQLNSAQININGSSELFQLRQDLSAARQKESDLLQRELAQKESVREMRRRISELEHKAQAVDVSRLHKSSQPDLEKAKLAEELAVTSEKLTKAYEKLHESQKQLRKVEEENLRKMKIREMEIQNTLSDFEASRASLQHDFTELRDRERTEKDRNGSLVKTVQRLERCVERLEKDLNMARSSTGSDPSITIERKDMHKMLRESKLEIEDLKYQLQTREEIVQDLRTQIETREEAIKAHSDQERDLRRELKRVRSERGHQSHVATTTYKELDRVRRDYDRTVEKMLKLQESFDGERKVLVREVKNLSTVADAIRAAEKVSAQHVEKVESKERSHAAEVREMARRISWHKAKATREKRFREDLVAEKLFMQKKIDAYALSNSQDVKALQGSAPLRAPAPAKKQPCLRSVVYMVIAINRMKLREAQWREHLRVKETLIKRALEKKDEKRREKGKARASGSRS